MGEKRKKDEHEMFKIGAAKEGDDVTLQIKVPPSGAIITQATMIALMPNGEAANAKIAAARVIDTIGVERYSDPKLPRRVQGESTLEVDASCEGAIAISLTLICNPRKGDAPVNDEADVEVDDVGTADR